MGRWMMYNKGADFAGLAEKLGVDPVVVRLMTNRDISPDQMETYLHPKMTDLNDPHLLKDAAKAAELLGDAIPEGKRIRVIGDYDIDGIFSTYILTEALDRLGARVDYDIPDRIADGYGMNIRLVEKAIAEDIDVLITCDNGIKAFDEVARARESGLKVIVTDHHELDFFIQDGKKVERIPEADAVVNPHQNGCSYPFPQICGAVVAWKLTYLLFEHCGVDPREADAFLGFAAFATVGDIMPLVDENRAIVSLGLRALSESDNPGIRALTLRCLGEGHSIDVYDIGFILGPCFNAAGRIDTAIRGVELLREKDPLTAGVKAGELQALNEQRKSMTQKGEEEAIRILESGGRASDVVVVVYVPGLHESLAGIVAGRLKEKLYRPVYVITDAKEGLKGSGRSIPGYSMAEKLHDAEDVLTKYGGHPMAAGVSLPKSQLDRFREILNEHADIEEKDLSESLMIDMKLPLTYLSEAFIRQLKVLEPCGEKNESPLFAVKDVAPDFMSEMGQGRFLKFGFGEVEAVYFGDGPELKDRLTARFGKRNVDALMRGRNNGVSMTFAYRPAINEFRGRKTLQARIVAVL